MKLCVIGPPTSGKTTQAQKIADQYNLPYLSTGELLRQNREKETDAGKPADYLERGKLVPDEMIIQLVKHQLQQPAYQDAFVLDGFPRTIEQAEALHRFSPVDIALLLDIDDYLIAQRMSERMTCPECGASYNLNTNPPSQYGICDRCHTDLEHRDDDTRDALQAKIDEYQQKTKKLIDFYQAYGKLHRIDANGTIDEVWQQIQNVIESH